MLQVLANQPSIVELLLKEGGLPADMRAAVTGATPLHALAALGGTCKHAAGQAAPISSEARARMAQLLLGAGADVAAVDACGAGILAAAAGGHLHCFQIRHPPFPCLPLQDAGGTHIGPGFCAACRHGLNL